jgi:hypothetical protein
MLRIVLGALVAISFARPALANWWLVRSSDQECLVVDVEPTDKSVTKIGKDSYPTEEQAEADAKRLCQEPKFEPKLDDEE